MEARQLAPASLLVLSLGALRRSLPFNEGAEFRIGRGSDCDLELPRAFASRHHARLLCRRQSFWLFDESSNGTFVRNEDESVLFLHRRSVRLWGSGLLSFGEPLTKESVVRFEHPG
jgi:adenylate cyclase